MGSYLVYCSRYVVVDGNEYTAEGGGGRKTKTGRPAEMCAVEFPIWGGAAMPNVPA